jgi:hypothetical protein
LFALALMATTTSTVCSAFTCSHTCIPLIFVGHAPQLRVVYEEYSSSSKCTSAPSYSSDRVSSQCIVVNNITSERETCSYDATAVRFEYFAGCRDCSCDPSTVTHRVSEQCEPNEAAPLTTSDKFTCFL